MRERSKLSTKDAREEAAHLRDHVSLDLDDDDEEVTKMKEEVDKLQEDLRGMLDGQGQADGQQVCSIQ